MIGQESVVRDLASRIIVVYQLYIVLRAVSAVSSAIAGTVGRFCGSGPPNVLGQSFISEIVEA
jgi:hypothetical protein